MCLCDIHEYDVDDTYVLGCIESGRCESSDIEITLGSNSFLVL